MTSSGSRLESPEGPLARAPAEPSVVAGAQAVLWGQNEDTRLLLRGLLRLHHCAVVHEVATLDELGTLPALAAPTVLIVDAESSSPGWEQDLSTALSEHPELRALVLLPAADRALEPRARAAGATTVVVRPFAIRDFVRAVAATAQAPAPATRPAG